MNKKVFVKIGVKLSALKGKFALWPAKMMNGITLTNYNYFSIVIHTI